MLIVLGTCLAMCAVVETMAAWMRVWVYRAAWHRAAHIVVGSALFASLSFAVLEQSMPLRFLAGAAAGVAIEALNKLALKIWTFPDDRMLVIRGNVPIILAAGVGWGALPAVAIELWQRFG